MTNPDPIDAPHASAANSREHGGSPSPDDAALADFLSEGELATTVTQTGPHRAVVAEPAVAEPCVADRLAGFESDPGDDSLSLFPTEPAAPPNAVSIAIGRSRDEPALRTSAGARVSEDPLPPNPLFRISRALTTVGVLGSAVAAGWLGVAAFVNSSPLDVEQPIRVASSDAEPPRLPTTAPSVRRADDSIAQTESAARPPASEAPSGRPAIALAPPALRPVQPAAPPAALPAVRSVTVDSGAAAPSARLPVEPPRSATLTSRLLVPPQANSPPVTGAPTPASSSNITAAAVPAAAETTAPGVGGDGDAMRPNIGSPAEIVTIEPPAVRATAPIETVLNRYAAAFSALDVTEAKAVWPSVDTRNLARAFASLEHQQFDLGACAILVTLPRAVASCDGTSQYVPKIGSKKLRLERRQWTFYLQQRADGWSIEGVDLR